MGTNLLLEGDDLEALLIRAHAEGGVNARIVRAEKVRQGGFMGFFARERFEVAVEIPDDATAPADTGEATGPGGTDEATGPGGTDVPFDVPLGVATWPPVAAVEPVPSPDLRPAYRSGVRRGPLDVASAVPGAPGMASTPATASAPGRASRPGVPVADPIGDVLAVELSRILATRPAAPARRTADGLLELTDRTSAADGLLELADRVSAAERAAARAAERATSRTLVTASVGGGAGPASAGGLGSSELTVSGPGIDVSLSNGRSAVTREFRPAFPVGGWVGQGVAGSPATGLPVLATGATAVTGTHRPAATSTGSRSSHGGSAGSGTSATASGGWGNSGGSGGSAGSRSPGAGSGGSAGSRSPGAGSGGSGGSRSPGAGSAGTATGGRARASAGPRANSGGPRAGTDVRAGARTSRQDEEHPAHGGGLPDHAGRPLTPASRPEFTTLLEQLRTKTLPPRPRTAGDLLIGQAAPTGVDPLDLSLPVDRPAPDPAAAQQARAQQARAQQAGTQQARTQQARAQQAYAPDGQEGRLPGPEVLTDPTAGPAEPTAGPAADHGPAEEYRPVLPAQTRALLAESRPSPDRGHTSDQATTSARAGVQRSADQRLTGDRRTLRNLGVPSAWTRRLRGGDRFAAVLRMLERMPDVDIDPDVEVLAVVGPRGIVQLEAHRTALDLPLDERPRPVVLVPRDARSRGAAIAKAHRLGTVVVAVETAGYACDDAVVETLQSLGASAVIAVVDAERPTEESQRWLDALGQVDAIAVDNTSAVGDPASALQLGVPVVRLDGISVDRVTWTALLCAQLEAADPAR